MPDLPSRDDARHLATVLLSRALYDDAMHDSYLIVAAYVSGQLVDRDTFDYEAAPEASSDA